ncbi:MAG TPA: CPBP family intramembrane glutamic endopeptidase [Anaerolineales bacterium]|nr:CPBP family intramembrane glutamic endopeptidase [Anaerolineales bacterium]
MNEFREIIQHFLRRLRQAPLLLGWLLIGPFIAFLINGWIGLVFGLINIVLLSVYAVFIRRMTPTSPSPAPIKYPRLELALALSLFGLILFIQLLDFDVWMIQPWYSWVRGFFIEVYLRMESLGGIPDWARNDMYSAVTSTIKQLIPTLLIFWLFGYHRADMGFARPHWKLTALLVGATAVFGLITGVLLRVPLVQVFGLYLIGILINALPEELFFRGFLLPRLEKFFADPLNALVVSALLFNAIHIPILMSNNATPLTALLGIFSIGYPSGLIWGYLYLRTRSIIPGMLWHAANGVLGFMMMSL